MKEVFQKIYLTNKWGSKESKSGKGSEIQATEELRRVLPSIIDTFKIKSVLDLPCGDYNYMKEVGLNCEYIGADIVPELIASNSMKYPKVKFQCLDIVKDKLPKSDLIIVRDCFVHLPIKDIQTALKNAKKSCKYMLVTSFYKVDFNKDIQVGDWRPLNMEIFPFNLEPITIIIEGDREYKYMDKSMILIEL